jgi:hypothetical protein
MVKGGEVHRITRQVLGNWLKGHGYENQRSQRTFWWKPSGRANVLIWARLDKYGYDPSEAASNHGMQKLWGSTR